MVSGNLFTQVAPEELVYKCTCIADRIGIWKCWFFGGDGKTGVPGEKPLGARGEPTTNATLIRSRVRESNQEHIDVGESRVLTTAPPLLAQIDGVVAFVTAYPLKSDMRFSWWIALFTIRASGDGRLETLQIRREKQLV